MVWVRLHQGTPPFSSLHLHPRNLTIPHEFPSRRLYLFLLLEGSTMRLARRRWIGVTAGAVAGGLLAPTGLANALEAAAGLTFEIYKDAKQEFRWRLKSANGQVIATSGQGYTAKVDCRHGIEVIQKEASEAKVEDLTAKK
jgi:uncharacterized protein YegP (UPF0339 family)